MTKTIKKSVAFLSAAVMVMAMLLYFPSGMFSNIDWGLTAFAEGNTAEGYTNGFCDKYELKADGSWGLINENDKCTHEDCNGYQPATLNGSNYEIGNAGQLYWFAALVNGDTSVEGVEAANTTACAKLTSDITVNTGVLDESGDLNTGAFRSWTPIGWYYNSSAVNYSGIFDGNNHTISGLYYNVTSNENEKYVYAGLFGRSGGTIKNVIVKDSYFGLIYLFDYVCRVGGVCGGNSGAIINCHNASNVTVTVSSNGASVGGVCGQNFPGGIIENCNNTGEVNVKGTYVGDNGGTGGVCGWNVNGTIKGCDNKGEVIGLTNVGGVCGCIRGTGTIQSCYNTAKVSGSNNVGGVCGYYFTYGADKPDGNTIESCYNTGEVSGTSYNVGGVCGWNSGYGTITDCYNEGKVSGTSDVGGVCGSNSDCGTITDCYNEGEVSGTSDVGGVCGSNSDCGTITDCYNEGEVSGTSYVGGVCGDSYAHLSDQTVTIKECYNTRKVTGKENVGGVCGMNYQGAITNSYNTGEVSGNESIGGVCGDNRVRGIVENCYNTGTVNLKEGEAESIGGVCGRNNNVTFSGTSTITNCYYDSNVYLGRAVGDNVEGGTVTNTEGKTTNQFASGSVCYLLNGSSSESPVWYQRLNTETYPNLDSTDSASRTVYQCTNCTGTYSNTENGYAEHSYIPYESDITKHICKKCGFYEAHSTTELTYTANDTTDEITVTCGECSGDLGTVTLSAPTGTLTYNGNAKEAVIYNDVNGVTILNPTITYSKTEDATFSGTPKDAGTYTASITLGTGEGAATVSVEFTIARRPVTITADNMSMTYGETEPELSYTVSDDPPLVDGEVLSGELSREAGKDAGTYKITQGTVTNDTNPNYDITFSEGTFTIDKAPTRETADCVMNLVYNESSESYTATITKVDGAEYRFGESGEWSTENTHTGIAPHTSVTGYIRIAGDENHNPGAEDYMKLTSGHGRLTHVEEKAVDCVTDGNREYWYCESCGQCFNDSEGTTETTKEAVTIPATNHNWNQENYELDATHHWHNCQNENCPITDNSQKDGYGEHVDSDNNGICDNCNKLIHSIVKEVSATLDGDIGLNYYIALPESVTADTGAYVQFTVNGQDTKVFVKDVTDIEGSVYKFTCWLTAKEMSDDVTFKLYDGNGTLIDIYSNSGDKVEGASFDYSLETYLNTLSSDENAALKDLADATLVYGAYAQNAFNHNADPNLDGSELADVTVGTLEANKITKSADIPEGLKLTEMTLILETETALRLYFKSDNIENYTFKLDGTGVTLNKIEEEGLYYVEIANISAKDLDTKHTLIINDNCELTFNALSYAYATVKADTNENICNVVKALYKYNDAANAYFGE